MKIVVLAGGISTERDVSLMSGSMIYQALRRKGHEVVLLDVYLGYEGTEEEVNGSFSREQDWSAGIGGIGEDSPDIETVKAMRGDGGRSFFGPNVLRICSMADVVFLGLHGESGENGKIQAAFDLLGIRYTGTDYVSSALAMDKALTKEIFAFHHIKAPLGIHLHKGKTAGEKLPYPCIVKACRGGSSVGVAVAWDDAQYETALAEAFRYDDEVVVEQYIRGREFSVCVLDKKALPVIEIAPKQGFYDYKNKYQAGSTVETCPADLPAEKSGQMQRIAEQVFEALRLRHYARMDFMMGQDGQIYCLEANTLPGMTPTSLIPQEAAAAGMSFDDLCQKIVDMALEG